MRVCVCEMGGWRTGIHRDSVPRLISGSSLCTSVNKNNSPEKPITSQKMGLPEFTTTSSNLLVVGEAVKWTGDKLLANLT